MNQRAQGVRSLTWLLVWSDHNKSSEDSGSESDSEGSPTVDDKKKDKQQAQCWKQNILIKNNVYEVINKFLHSP